MDFIKCLPIEVTELIICYLDGGDILRCCLVCRDWKNILHSERTWSILCRQRGWRKDDGEHAGNWRECYWLNYNWREGVYDRHRRPVPEGGLQVDLNQQFVITSHVMGSEIWRFDKTCKLHQTIYCGDLHFQTKVTGKSMVIKLADSVRLYAQDKMVANESYRTVKAISTVPNSPDYDPDLNLASATLQTGSDRLVVVQKEIKGHKILLWNLNDGYKYDPLLLEDNVKHIFKTIVFSGKLYLVTLVQNEYRIRIYYLNDGHRYSEVTAFKNVAFGVIPPEMQVSEKLIVSFCPTEIGRDLCYGYSPLKVWDSNGGFMRSIILNSGRIDYFAFCLSKDLVVYRSSETLVKVWRPETDEEVCNIAAEPEICKIDKTIGTLLVLSYERFFEVWDYRWCTRLYRVFDTHTAIQNRIVINRYYYAKQDRNKNLVTVFSFTNKIDSCDNIFLTEQPHIRSDILKGIM